MSTISPDYKRIYMDILHKKYPEKKEECNLILKKRVLSFLDILTLNKIIFSTNKKESQSENQKHRSYSKSDILQILDYQKKHQLKNVQVARHFNISRNSIAKWKKIFVT